MRYWISTVLAVVLVMVNGVHAAAEEKGKAGSPPEAAVMKPEIRMIPKMTVAYVRHVGPYEECETAWKKLMTWAGKNSLFARDTVFLGVSYDDPESVPADKLRYDACMTVPKKTKAGGEVKIQEVAGREYAVFIHRGPYENMKTTYEYIYKKWAPTAERPITYDPALEIYKDDPKNTPPEKLVTEICVPLRN